MAENIHDNTGSADEAQLLREIDGSKISFRKDFSFDSL